MKCRHCGTPTQLPFLDLGSSPPSNAYLSPESLNKPERWYPLRVLVCANCWLVQTEDYAHYSELFADDYHYFSSFSTSWLAHAEHYVKTVIERFGLNANSHFVEVASNDGYLLQYVKAYNIPHLGIEPTASTATAARHKGIEVIQEFFGVELARHLTSNGKQADLIAANNVLAHVPDINNFVAGFALLLKPNGVATFEFPYLLNIIDGLQFDTIYHEHFSYLSLTAASRILERNGLHIFDVEHLPTHGGSIRVYTQRRDTGTHPIGIQVEKMLSEEIQAGVKTIEFYTGFQANADRIKNDFLIFLLQAKHAGKVIVAYGAAAKGNTLINYAGVREDLIKFVIDRNPAKQGKFMPGSRIPIVDENKLREIQPDYIFVLPWNLKEEITQQLQYVREWGAKFVTVIPNLEVI